MASRGIVGWTIGVFVITIAGAAAQPQWELEVHAGAQSGRLSSDGTGIGEFPRGNPIPTGGGTFNSRAVSSWYFGDGSLLLNQVNGTFNVAARITPLDALLRQSIVDRKDGGVFGVRVGRHLTDRLTAEFSVGYARSRLRLSDDAATAIEATRSTFISAWLALLGTGATSNRVVTSVADVEEGDGHQLVTTGAVRVRFGGSSRFAPFVRAGLGGVFNRGTTPSVSMTGIYSFTFGGVVPLSESDRITIRAIRDDRALVGVLGGGFIYNLSDRHGVRVDAALQLGGSTVNTVVDATPSVTPGTTVFTAVSTGFNPSIQFSNSSVFNRPSSLSGPAISGQETFTGSGRPRQINVTVGYVVRF